MSFELRGLARVFRAKEVEESGLAARNAGHGEAAAFHRGKAEGFAEVAGALERRAEFLECEDEGDREQEL